MLKKIAILILVLGVFTVYGQDVAKTTPTPDTNEEDAKYTVVSAMINQVIQTAEGLIVEYKIDRNFRTTYIPNKFFKDKIAVRIDENNTNISPQMSIVLRNSKPHRVKLYLATKLSNMTYRYADLITDATKKKFEINELTIEF